MSVISYYTDKDGNHIEAGTGKLLSTREQREKQDVPEWKKFELRRIEELDGKIVSGPNALPQDIKKYGPYRHNKVIVREVPPPVEPESAKIMVTPDCVKYVRRNAKRYASRSTGKFWRELESIIE